MIKTEPDPYCKGDKFAAKNGMVVTELGENFAKAQMTIDESFLNGLDIPMGGVYFTLGDFTFGAANQYITNGVVTLDASIDFIASAKLGDTVTATCTQVSRARKIVRNVIEMHDQNGKLLCVMRCTGYRKETWN